MWDDRPLHVLPCPPLPIPLPFQYASCDPVPFPVCTPDLINAGGIIEQTFAPGPYAMRLSSLVYKRGWSFEEQALPADLRAR